MKVVTVEALKKAGFTDPAATFTEIALAGGFGSVAPNHEGGLDIDGIDDAKAKQAVAAILSKGTTEKKESPKV